MRLRKAGILIANDNPAIRSALALLLETRLHVHIVGEADNMENLLEGILQSHPDIIILELELPGLPKEAPVAALRAVNSQLKVVATSSRLDIAQQAQDAQADAYVCISEPPEQVVQVIQTIWKFPPK
jgi:DNA-binding NarL/FixJ family response regulator